MRSRKLVFLLLVGLGSMLACGGKAVTSGPGAGDDDGSGTTRGAGSSGSATGGTGGNGAEGGGRNVSNGTGGTGGGTADVAVASPATAVTVVSVTSATTNGTSSTTGGIMPPNGFPLSPRNGWVSADSNGAGIQGAFWTATDNDDGGTFLISPPTFANSGSEICVNGTAEQVLNMQYEVYWGGTVGFNLNQAEADSDMAASYDAEAAGVTGFGFDVSALPIGGQLRFGVQVEGEASDVYCKTITSITGNRMYFRDLELSCWAAEDRAPDPTRIRSVFWQIVTNDSAPYDFDFCIEEIIALTD